ncbi:MAG TPA: hypothetical protein VM488_18290 [Pseudobacter sp.]|nr:hypothetical protein [Pseudobacter sp.]
MKNLILSLAFLWLGITTVTSQEVLKTRKVVQVLSEQSFFLNGGFRASMGGKSRNYFEVKLPPNTVEWYYTITTIKGDPPSKETLQLASQLGRMIDPTGVASLTLSAIMVPTGAYVCDVLLMDLANATAFVNKADLNNGNYRYYPTCSRKNFRSGVVRINDITKGNWYLGVKNPSETTGIGIILEVAAIVEVVNEEKLAEKQKAINFGNLGWRSYENGDIEKCIEYTRKSLQIDSTNGIFKSNLALCYLIKGDDQSATELYMEAVTDLMKMTPRSEGKRYLQATIDDLVNASKKYITLREVDNLLSFMKGELANL